jgi:hypothetical protein
MTHDDSLQKRHVVEDIVVEYRYVVERHIDVDGVIAQVAGY